MSGEVSWRRRVAHKSSQRVAVDAINGLHFQQTEATDYATDFRDNPKTCALSMSNEPIHHTGVLQAGRSRRRERCALRSTTRIAGAETTDPHASLVDPEGQAARS